MTLANVTLSTSVARGDDYSGAPISISMRCLCGDKSVSASGVTSAASNGDGDLLNDLAAGYWSDRLGQRLRPIRAIAAAAALSMGALALSDWLSSPVAVAAMVVASVITVSDNGLAFTAIAEIAGPFWSGRALGTQNTSQLLTHAFVPPVFGALIGAFGYPAAFAVCALFPLAALPIVPDDREINEQS